ncbi:MAG: DUF2752 domain-containing protein [Planctomycetaceae bacterium]
MSTIQPPPVDDVEWLSEPVVGRADRDVAEDAGTGTETIRRAKSSSRHHAILLGLACCVWLAALSLEVLPDQRVRLRFGSNWTVPETCALRYQFQLPCPGCGLTRGFVHLARLEVRSAWELNAAGVIVAALVAVQIPYRVSQLIWPGWIRWTATEVTVICVTPIVLLWLQWGVKLYSVLGWQAVE